MEDLHSLETTGIIVQQQIHFFTFLFGKWTYILRISVNEIEQHKKDCANISNIFQTRIESLEKSMHTSNNPGT